jgi:hypothetical protein
VAGMSRLAGAGGPCVHAVENDGALLGRSRIHALAVPVNSDSVAFGFAGER